MRGNWFYEINSLLFTISYKRVCLIVRQITSLGRMEDFAKRLGPRLKVAIKSWDECRKLTQTIADDRVYEKAQKLVEIRQIQTISLKYGTETWRCMGGRLTNSSRLPLPISTHLRPSSAIASSFPESFVFPAQRDQERAKHPGNELFAWLQKWRLCLQFHNISLQSAS